MILGQLVNKFGNKTQFLNKKKNQIKMMSKINSNKSSNEYLLIYLYHLGICKMMTKFKNFDLPQKF